MVNGNEDPNPFKLSETFIVADRLEFDPISRPVINLVTSISRPRCLA